jgi:hypothetical protein
MKWVLALIGVGIIGAIYAFFKSVSQSLEEFFTSNEMRTLIQSVIEIPQSVVQSITTSLSSFTGSTFSSGITGVSDEIDAITGAW